jgi:ribonucleoside-diphosphate reductase alpha chain
MIHNNDTGHANAAPKGDVMSAVKIERRITGFAVRTAGEHTAPKLTSVSADADRRLVLTKVSTPLARSLRWASRPDDPDGHASRTYRIASPEGTFTVTVAHVDNGTPQTGYVFEVWVNDGAPRGLKALCKSLSMDMRSRDRAWLLAKLDSLAKTKGVPFDFVLPGGLKVQARGAVAAFAMVVKARCQELGTFDEDKLVETPLIDALMSRKEPKAYGEGTLGWMVPIAHTGYPEDDFEMVVKEVALECGKVVPQSIWFSGDYPSSLDGLAKSLSLDLRVNDTQWQVLKLQQLLDMDEPKGAFWAKVPGSEKSTSYPSLVSYIATLILHRLKVLGLIDDSHVPTSRTDVVTLELVRTESAQEPHAPQGDKCGECGAYAVRQSGGCDVCASCGASKCS